jgi:hypothetical protein
MNTDIEKKEREFSRDLDGNFNIVVMPFVKYFKDDADLKNRLFEEYLKTELKPNFGLYSEKHLAADELKNVRNNETKVDKLWSDYIELIKIEELPKEFYTHHISDTTIYEELSFVKQKMDDFYKTKETETDKQEKYAISFAKIVINTLDRLSLPKLKKEILNKFVENKENTDLFMQHSWFKMPKTIYDKALRDFRNLKTFADNYIVKHLKNEQLQQTEPEPFDLSDTSAVEKTSFINKFDRVPESKVIEYFTKNLVENKHLTKETLTAYLKQAFELETLTGQKYSFENVTTRGKIVSIFYKYYRETADKPYGKQKKYLELLKLYFNGFDKIDIRNFSK